MNRFQNIVVKLRKGGQFTTGSGLTPRCQVELDRMLNHQKFAVKEFRASIGT